MSKLDYKRMERPQLERRLAGYVDYVTCGCSNSDVCLGHPNCARADVRRLVRRLRSITQRERQTKGRRP